MDNKTTNFFWTLIGVAIMLSSLLFDFFSSYGPQYGRAAVIILFSCIGLSLIYYKVIKPSYIKKIEERDNQIKELQNKIDDNQIQTSVRLYTACHNLHQAINRIERKLDISQTKGDIFREYFTYDE